MRVLHVYTGLSPELGGPVHVIKGLTEHLVKEGIDISIYATTWGSKEKSPIEPDGVEIKIFKCDWFSRFWPAHSLALARALKQESRRFDLIHIHGPWNYPAYAAYNYANQTGIPYIVTIHGTLDEWRLRHKAIKKILYTVLVGRRLLNHATVIHAITRSEVYQIKHFRVSSPVVVIPNGINFDDFNHLPPKENIDIRYPELKGKIVLLFLGRIHPMKGLEVLVSAFEQVASYLDDVRLIIAGPEDSKGYQREVEHMFENKGIRDKVIFTGMLTGKEKMEALSRADIFVLPSHSEGFSMAILEAMVCSLPVVITRQCHFPEVNDAQAGIVTEHNPDQFAAALMKLIENKPLREKMGENARQLVFEQYTWNKVAEQMISLYESVINNKTKICGDG